MNPEVAAVLKQSALRQCCDIVYRWHWAGASVSFQAWKGMISQKKALSQSWVAQRRALAKIEQAKMGQAASEVVIKTPFFFSEGLLAFDWSVLHRWRRILRTQKCRCSKARPAPLGLCLDGN